MKQNLKNTINVVLLAVFILVACTPAEPTPDASAIATSAVQTVEARYTEQALLSAPTITPEPTATLAEPTPEAGQATPTTPAGSTNYEFVPGCVFVTFVADITVPDGQLVTPGQAFTKTWRLRNTGSCAWDSRFSLIYFTGEKFGDVLSVPLPRVVYPGQDVDISVPMVAPSELGTYTSEWRLKVPVGTAGVGQADANITTQIQVVKDVGDSVRVTKVTYQLVREPAKGCPAEGTRFTFTAYLTTNGPGEVIYRWDRTPFDGIREWGKVKFDGPETKAVQWVWLIKPSQDQINNKYRWMQIFVEEPNNEAFNKFYFEFDCSE